ncbi:glycosyltransferase family 4 protein [Bacteroides bouchesdurhonensis]|uniref:glycosyltransferase family 4 protein n=1 Tax=Bacteroides bouchesdurhonensis TaxID=1841855 RepID=UPI00097F9093|nr:glycosyltransferase family 4 protein [Bacteroides bouchesdurhonensis]
MKQRLWLVSELFPPEETSTGYIMGEIANAMTKKYDVTVVCGPAVYDKNKKQVANNKFILDDGIKLIRVEGIEEDKNCKLSRIKKFVLMSYRLYKVLNSSVRKEDKVLMVSNPFPMIVLGAWLRRRRKFHLTMLVHDVFPEGLYTDMNLPLVAYRIMGCIFNRAYATVDTMISLGRDMTEVMQNKVLGFKSAQKQKVVQIENWGDIVSIQPRKTDIVTTDKIVIEYAGNVGKAQGVSEFIKILEETGNENLQFSIWGTGSEFENIKKYIKEKQLKNIMLNGAYSRSQQYDVLNACDLALIKLVDGMYGLGVPSKSYNIMAAGKPILFIGDLRSEIALTVKENGLGYCFDTHDREGLLIFLKSLSVAEKTVLVEMGMKSRKICEEKYSKEVILEKFVQTL